MAEPNKILPVKCNLDLAAEHIDNLTARFIKNLSPNVGATNEYEGIKEGQNVAKQKPTQSTEIYVNIPLPQGDNYCIGAKGFPNTGEVYFMLWNSLSNHSIYRLNCYTRTFDKVKVDSNFNFQKKPQYLIGEGQMMLSLIQLVEPETGKEVVVKELKWTDGFGYQGFCRVDDSIATNGFDANLFPYFAGNYDKAPIVRMGKPTPKGCVTVTEIPRVTDPLSPDYDLGVNNSLLFQKWYFMIQEVDVWGRPSEWGPRSIEYIPGVNDCISLSNNVPRCLNLEFEISNPFVNSVNIAWLNCSRGEATVWHKEDTLFLYKGSNIGKWWLRDRSDVWSGPTKVKYKFCRTKECEIVPSDEVARIENPLARRSQAIMDLNRLTAIYNNKHKFNPFSDDLKSKITATVIPPSQTDSGTRNITIYCPIWNEGNANQGIKWAAVSKDGNNGYVYGGYTGNNSAGTQFNPTFARKYLQYFTNKDQSGFVGYLVGGGSAISTQVVYKNGVFEDDPNFLAKSQNAFAFTMQKFEFTNVPKGRFIFRLASQLSDPNTDAAYRKTSTPVWGACKFTGAIPNGTNINTNGRSSSQELLIDVCDSDYNTLTDQDKNILVIADMADVQGNTGQEGKATSGYWWETKSNGYNQNPIELINVISSNGYTSNITDHNGFYYYSTRGNGRSFAFDLISNCNWWQKRESQGGPGMRRIDYWADEQTGIYDYFTLLCNRVKITGRLVLQGTNIGVSNTLVTITRGGSAVTDDNGVFTIIAHDFVLPALSNQPRLDKITIGNGCGYTGENNSCIPVVDVTINKCTLCQSREVVLAPDIILQYVLSKGLLSGGNKGLGCVGFDWLGRVTFVQPLGYLDIPSVNQTGVIAPSQIQININSSAVFPPEIEYISFFVTPETKYSHWLTWIVDDFTFIDSQGNENLVNPTQIKIYYGSNIQYSKLHNYNTTTAWQFLAAGTDTPVLNDRVQFILNGNGAVFTKAITGLVKYDKSGEYFTIDYSSDLKDLKKNALVRFVRPKECTGDEPYYEICSSKVEIVNQKAQRNSFILDAFDTYYLTREIPVPVPVTTPTTKSITTTVTNGNTAVATEVIPIPTPTILELRTFGFRFEHFAPSNFWGDGCLNIGRVQVKNPYEAEIISPYQVAISGALSVNGQLNYLCYFDSKKMTDFDVPESDGICAVFQEIGKIFVITQMDCWVVGYNDNLARVNQDGTVQAGSISNAFGKPQRKEGGGFGCDFKDKLSVKVRGNKIMWVDRDAAEAVQYDWRDVKSLTSDKCDAWFRAKVKKVLEDENSFFIGGIDPIKEGYLLSNNNILAPVYINQERGPAALLPETVEFSIESGDLKGWWSFVPECFAHLDGDVLNNQMFSFKEGVAWSHYNGKQNNSYNRFYGTLCEKVIRPIFAGENPFDKKMFLAITVYCENQKFFSDKIFTEAKQESRLLLDWWEKEVYFSVAAFLCDLNTVADPNLLNETGVNKLLDGDKLYGNWIDVRLIGDLDANEKYCEILGIQITSFKYG